jgi:hypothetical protein
MKKQQLLLFAIFLVSTLTLSAQSPQGFNYQTVVRNAAGEILANQSVGTQFILHQSTPAGTAVYTETWSTSTNDYGLLSFAIGNGTSTDDFSLIDWSVGPYYLETLLDVSGGATYVSMGTSQLMSTPYAQFSQMAANVVNDNVDDADSDATNELITDLTLNGSLLEITDAGGTQTVDMSKINDLSVCDETSISSYVNAIGTGVASASSELDPFFDASKAFDGDCGSDWVNASGQTSGWIQYDFGLGNEKIIKRYTIFSGVSNGTPDGRAPKTWTFEGSNDGTNFTVLDTQSISGNISGICSAPSEFDITNQLPFQFYRLNITAIVDGAFPSISIRELKFMEATYNTDCGLSANSNGVGIGIENPTQPLEINTVTQSSPVLDTNLTTRTGNWIPSYWTGQSLKAINSGKIHGINIYINNEGTVDLTMRLILDAITNDVVGVSNLTNAELVVGWNSFIFPEGIDVTAGQDIFFIIDQGQTQANSGGFSFATCSSCYSDGSLYWSSLANSTSSTTISFELFLYNETTNTVVVDDSGNLGLGIASPSRTLHVKDVMRLEPRATPPSSPSAGDIYFDSVVNKLMVYDGATWQACW